MFEHTGVLDQRRQVGHQSEALLVAENTARYAFEISNRCETLTYLDEVEDVEKNGKNSKPQ